VEDGMAMNIGEAAERAGITPKMVRHYESLGLLPTVRRSDAGYRVYAEPQVHTLRFIKRARDLGFSMAEIAELVRLWQDRRRPSARVKQLAEHHVQALDAKIEALQAMRRTLGQLVRGCHGDERPDCPILDDLEGLAPVTSAGPPAARPRPSATRRSSPAAQKR
jgi:MerR family transcriptional regulator, copper efflux regulator